LATRHQIWKLLQFGSESVVNSDEFADHRIRDSLTSAQVALEKFACKLAETWCASLDQSDISLEA